MSGHRAARALLRRLGLVGAPAAAAPAAPPLAAAAGARRHQSASPAFEELPHDGGEAPLLASNLTVTLAPPRPKPPLEGLAFGAAFTDHMLTAGHAAGAGWGAPAIAPLAPLAMHPASQVLHYGNTCLEGLKAYAGPDGAPRLFRPAAHAARLRRSAARLALADFDAAEVEALLHRLVAVDASWLPHREGYALYVRPFMFASAPVLGVGRSAATTLAALLSPVGPYFAGAPAGAPPPGVALFVEERAARAWPGGVGDVKVGGNYAPTILPAARAAAAHGTQQVAYTDARAAAAAGGGPDDARFEECGAMNLFFVFAGAGGGVELATPRLDDGTILGGITRDSVLQLAAADPASFGLDAVAERDVTLREARAAAAEGRLLEVFGSGTACVVQPVSRLVRADGSVMAPARVGTPDSVAARLRRRLTDIQYGREEHPWSVRVEV